MCSTYSLEPLDRMVPVPSTRCCESKWNKTGVKYNEFDRLKSFSVAPGMIPYNRCSQGHLGVTGQLSLVSYLLPSS